MQKDLCLTNKKTNEKKDVSMMLLNTRKNWYSIVAINKSEFRAFADKLDNLQNKLNDYEIYYDDEYQNLVNDIQDSALGFCQFALDKDRYCYLNLVRVKQENRNFGIGSNLLKLMESYAKRRGSYFVEGKFIPDKDASNFVEKFYIKNGYKIEYEGYRSMVEKSLYLIDKEENGLSF